jgi:hypothetical protein
VPREKHPAITISNAWVRRISTAGVTADYVIDVATFVAVAKSRDGGRPVFSLTEQIDKPILNRFRQLFASCTERTSWSHLLL